MNILSGDDRNEGLFHFAGVHFSAVMESRGVYGYMASTISIVVITKLVDQEYFETNSK